MQSFACTVTTDHLWFRFLTARPGETRLVVFLHTCILQSAAHVYCRRVTWDQPAQRNVATTEPTRWQRLVSLAITSSRVQRLWFLACVLTAAPGVVYSTVKAGVK
eukprot:4341982-Amphidinium_carterae.1